MPQTGENDAPSGAGTSSYQGIALAMPQTGNNDAPSGAEVRPRN